MVTDPGSPLVDTARELGFRSVFENDPNIGGRYSVLSYFGLVPAALAGVNLEALLSRAQVAEASTTSFDDTSSNSGLWLGLVMGELALQGRDKVTFIVSPPIESFGLWAEQLIAESTGKHGKGILPVADEPLGAPESYGNDRLFAYLRNSEDPDEDLDAKVRALADAGHPTVTMSVEGAADLGRIFFFAEFATAVAGWVLGINPFDQPNVQEAKDNTAKLLAAGDLPDVDPGDLAELLGQAKPPHYVAVLGFLRALRRDRRRRGRAAHARSATRATPPPRSGTGPATSTPRASCTRAGRPPGCSSSFCTTATRTWRFPARDTDSAT